MNKGDTLRLILDYSCNGREITEDQFDEIELQLNPESFGRYNVKLLRSAGDIYWDDEFEKFVAIVEQEDSFKLPNHVDYQLRCYLNGSVVSSKIGHFVIGDTLSRMEIGDEEWY